MEIVNTVSGLSSDERTLMYRSMKVMLDAFKVNNSKSDDDRE